MFRAYAAALWQRGRPDLPDPATLVREHDEPSGYLTYPVRCMRHVEILSLLELLPDVVGAEALPARDEIRRYVVDTIRNHPGCAHPISDRWAVSIVPPAVVLLRSGDKDRLAEYLLAITKWVADRYEREHLGLAWD